MKRLFFLLLIFSGCSVLTPFQKSKLLTVSNFIDTGKYADAKEAVEELVKDSESVKWARTWYYKGLLCQNAYQEGVKKNDKSLTELYPNQLFVAFESYQRARTLDKGGRLDRQLAPRYVLLANDFQKLGERHYKSKNYADALKAFEYALRISKSPILEVETENNLVYNAALAAFEGEQWDSAIKHLSSLHKNKYSTNATHLLYKAHLNSSDSLAAKKVLYDGIESYKENIELILLLTDLLYNMNEFEEATKMLDKQIARNPKSYKLYYTKGLIYQKKIQYEKAIELYTMAANHSPKEASVYFNLATCYYNIGVEIEEQSRTITNNRIVQEKREKSRESMKTAINWLDKAYENISDDEDLLNNIYDLYRALRVPERANN